MSIVLRLTNPGIVTSKDQFLNWKGKSQYKTKAYNYLITQDQPKGKNVARTSVHETASTERELDAPKAHYFISIS